MGENVLDDQICTCGFSSMHSQQQRSAMTTIDPMTGMTIQKEPYQESQQQQMMNLLHNLLHKNKEQQTPIAASSYNQMP